MDRWWAQTLKAAGFSVGMFKKPARPPCVHIIRDGKWEFVKTLVIAGQPAGFESISIGTLSPRRR
jgi:hypothetical protein